MSWQGLDQWQQWTLAIAGSLAATSIVWICRRLFGSRTKESSPPPIQQTASPVMMQTFQPTIKIHPPEPSPVPEALQIKVSFGFLVYGTSLGDDQMILFSVGNNASARRLQLRSIHLALAGGKKMVFLHMDGETRMPCFIEPGLSLNFWEKLSEVKSALREKNYSGLVSLYAVATDGLGNEYTSKAVDVLDV